ncbi:hypothetical protein FB107DRAFT_202837 [Schizophyllum commune]
MASYAPPTYASSSRSDSAPQTPTFPDPVYSAPALRSGMSLSSLAPLDATPLPPYTLSRPPSYCRPSCGSAVCVSSATRIPGANSCGSPTCRCALDHPDLESQVLDRKHWPREEQARKSKLRKAGEIACCVVLIVGLVGIPLAVNRLTMHP